MFETATVENAMNDLSNFQKRRMTNNEIKTVDNQTKQNRKNDNSESSLQVPIKESIRLNDNQIY